MARSDVAIAMKQTDYEKLQKAIEELDEDTKEDVTHFMKGVSLEVSSENKEYVILKWEWVKWYDYFPEVEFILNFLEEIEKYDYIRIGEDYDDIECEFNSDDYVIGIEHKITCS